MNICVLFLFGVLIYLSFGVYFHFQTFEAVTDSSKGSLNRCILIQCAIRVFSFLTSFVISVSNAYPSDDNTTSSSSFLQKVQLCIFSFPDFFFVGMYISIVMIWSEGHLKVWILVTSYSCSCTLSMRFVSSPYTFCSRSQDYIG
jgi:hypothetical protein